MGNIIFWYGHELWVQILDHALICDGSPDRFTFLGFLPRKFLTLKGTVIIIVMTAAKLEGHFEDEITMCVCVCVCT